MLDLPTTSLGSADDAVWSRASTLSFVGPVADRLAAAIGSWHAEAGGGGLLVDPTRDPIPWAQLEARVRDA